MLCVFVLHWKSSQVLWLTKAGHKFGFSCVDRNRCLSFIDGQIDNEFNQGTKFRDTGIYQRTCFEWCCRVCTSSTMSPCLIFTNYFDWSVLPTASKDISDFYYLLLWVLLQLLLCNSIGFKAQVHSSCDWMALVWPGSISQQPILKYLNSSFWSNPIRNISRVEISGMEFYLFTPNTIISRTNTAVAYYTFYSSDSISLNHQTISPQGPKYQTPNSSFHK